MGSVALNEEIGGVPFSAGTKSPASTAIEVSSLSNGVKVVTKSTGSASAAVAASVMAGSRFGSDGQALLLKHMAFKGTTSRSDIRLARDVEEAGISVGSDVGREQLVLSASGDPGAVLSTGTTAVAETLRSLKTVDWNLAEIKAEYVAKALRSITPEQMLVEKIHAAAFGEESPLGQPLYTADDDGVSGAALEAYLARAVAAPGAVTIVGAGGISHADVVAQAEALFGGFAVGDGAPAARSPFVGGYASHKLASSTTQVAVAIPGGALGSKEYAAALVLKELLGAGGFNFAYSDAGVVGIAGSAAPAAAGALVESFVATLTTPFADATVVDAKAAVKTKMLLALEDVTGAVGALASAGAAAGDIEAVDAVTASSIRALTTKVANPALATVGSATSVPAYNTLAKKFC